MTSPPASVNIGSFGLHDEPRHTSIRELIAAWIGEGFAMPRHFGKDLVTDFASLRNRPGEVICLAEVSPATAYDSFAKSYDANRDQFDLTEVLAEFYQYLPESGDLLDLGCGAGEPVAATFVERGWNVTGVDVSAAMLDLASRRVPGIRAIHGDMRSVDFPDRSFDAITLVYSLFHVPRADHPGIFGNLRRWLRPGGTALFTYATKAYTGHDQFDGTMEFMGHDLRYSHTTPEELFGQLAAADLTVVDARERVIGAETFLWVTVRSVSIPFGR